MTGRSGMRRIAVIALVSAAALVASQTAAAGGEQTVTLDGQTVILENQGEASKIKLRENTGIDCEAGSIRVARKVELSSGKTLNLTAPAGQAILAVSIKSGANYTHDGDVQRERRVRRRQQGHLELRRRLLRPQGRQQPDLRAHRQWDEQQRSEVHPGDRAGSADGDPEHRDRRGEERQRRHRPDLLRRVAEPGRDHGDEGHPVRRAPSSS